jgi:ElaB/YqjD/DUF883 family membrane-anchored ribosome-binding protein
MNATKAKGEESGEAERGDALTTELSALRAEVLGLAERLKATEAAAVERARALAGDLGDELRRVEEGVIAETRRHPWRSLGIAAAAGFVIGLVLRR